MTVERDDEDFREPHRAKRCRLGTCEVCDGSVALYTCPACQVKTCSLPCVAIHKKELDCTGIRNRVQFKKLDSFTDIDLHSDYSLLEEMGRSVERVAKTRRTFQKNMAYKWLKMKNHLWKRGTRLDLLPPTFSKHINNTSYFNWNTGLVYWRVEWIFPQSVPNSLSIVDDRVEETCKVSELLERHLLSPAEHTERLKPYQDAGGIESIKVLIKVEKMSGKPKYFHVTTSLSLGENLEGINIIEYPTLYVVLSSSIQQYHVVTPESLKSMQSESRDNSRKKPYRRGCNSGSMKFFSDNISDNDTGVTFNDIVDESNSTSIV